MTEREGRGRAQIRNPAEAVAIAKCWLATWTRRVEGGGFGLPPTSSFHPMKCAYCDDPRDLLVQMLEEFAEWGKISSHDAETPMRLELEQWEALPQMEHQRLVYKAQHPAPPPLEREDNW